jgi:hypothetical protein
VLARGRQPEYRLVRIRAAAVLLLFPPR